MYVHMCVCVCVVLMGGGIDRVLKCEVNLINSYQLILSPRTSF